MPKRLIVFEFNNPRALGVIDEALFTVAVSFPFGTDVTALVAAFTHNGASVEVGAVPQTSGVSVQDFSAPVTYTVWAEDDSTQEYVVTVSVATTPDGDEDTIEWRLLDTDLVTHLGILPAVDSGLYLQLNEPGSGSLKVHSLASTAAGMIRANQFVIATYRGEVRGGFFVEHIGDVTASAGETADLWMSISGRGAMALLDDGEVYPESNADTKQSTRDFESQKPAAVLITLIEEAKARGALQNLFYDFTAANDSTPAAWVDVETFSFTLGKSLLDVVREMSELGIEFSIAIETDGTFTLSAYKTAIGTDKSDSIYFRRGVNCTGASNAAAGNEVKNAYLVKYDGGYAHVLDAPAIAASRRREGVIDAFSSFKPGTAVSFGNARLSASKNPKVETSIDVYDGKGPRVFLDYGVGDWITTDMSGTEARSRVSSVTLKWGEQEMASVGVGLNSEVYENEIKQSNDIRRLQEKTRRQHDAKKLEFAKWIRIGKTSDINYGVRAQCLIGDILYVGGNNIHAITALSPNGVNTRMGGILSPSSLLSFNTLTGEWTDLLSPSYSVLSIVANGTDLYLGCYYGDVKKYDTLTGIFSGLGTGITPREFTDGFIAALDIVGDYLYVGGDFLYAGTYPTFASGGLARWHMVDEVWESVETALGSSTAGMWITYALTHIGNVLYIGGSFGFNTQIPDCDYVASYDTDTDTLTDLDGTLDGAIYSLAVYDTDKILAGGAQTGHLSLWDGVAWANFIPGINGNVYAIKVVDDTSVYFTGAFTAPAAYIAAHIGGLTQGMAGGLNGPGYSLENRNSDISVGGVFTQAGEVKAIDIAVYLTTLDSLADHLQNGAGSNGFNMGEAIRSATLSAITDSDKIGFWESAANALRSITWLSIKDTLFPPAGADRLLLTSALGHPTTDERFYWDDSKGLIYLGGAGGVDDLTINATVLNLLAKADNTQIVQTMHTWGAGSSVFPLLAAYRSGGTKATPTALQNGYVLFSASGFGHDGVGWVSSSGARFRFAATENWSATNHGAAVFFDGTPNASTTRREFGKVTELGFDVPTGSFYHVNGVPIPTLTDGDKGDITVSASGATFTIDDGAVTLAKQADMATASLVYRKTAGTGAPEVNTLATLKTDLALAASDIAMPKIGNPTIDNLAEDFTTRGSSGVIDGTLTYVTAASGTTIDVAAGEGYIRVSNDQQAELKIITWAAVSGITIPTPAAGYETVRFIGIEYNAGSPQVTVRTAFDWNWYSDFPLARVSIDALGLMHVLNAYAHTEDTANLTRKWMRLNFPFHREEPPEGSGGIIIGETGTRNLTLTPGYIWHGYNRYYVPARNTSGTDRFDLLYRRAGGGFTGTSANSQWPNTQYDDGSGTLATMTVNRYACLWIYLDVAEDAGGIPGFDIVYGRGQYTSSTLAQAEAAPTIPDHLTYHGRLIARLIFQKSAATATLIESTWTSSMGSTAISDHSQLSNLQGGTAGEYYHLTVAQNTVVSNTSGTNTGDNSVNSLYSGLVTNATHTGEVTGATALTVDKTAINNKTIVTAVGTDYVLISDTSDSGNLKKALVSDFGVSIPLVASDPVAPADGEMWLLRTTVGAIADGVPMGMLLALTYTGNTGTNAPLQLSVWDNANSAIIRI